MALSNAKLARVQADNSIKCCQNVAILALTMQKMAFFAILLRAVRQIAVPISRTAIGQESEIAQ